MGALEVAWASEKNLSGREGLFKSSDAHAGVVPAETERIAQSDIDLHVPGVVGNIVQIALIIGMIEIDSRRRAIVPHGHHCGD